MIFITSFNYIDLIRYLIILSTRYICTLIIVHKACQIKLTKKSVIFFSFCTIIISCSCAFLRATYIPFYTLLFIALTIISILAKFKRYYLLIPVSFISLGISYLSEILSVIIISSVFFLFKCYNPTILSDIFTSILQISFVILLFKVKRIENGFRFFENKNNFGVGLLIAGPTLILEGIYKEDFELNTIAFLLFAILISALGLFLWIRSAITRHYRKKLEIRAENYSKKELAEKQEEIEKLLNENASLSSIIHLDNYLINKMEITLKNKNDEAINNLLTLSKQRNEFVNNKIISDKLLPTTSNNDVDAVISDMYIKAASRGIDFILNTDCDINYLIHNIIEQADFEELIRICITNSIVNIENNPDTNGKILITISKPNDIYEFTIMDNGIVKDNKNKLISQIIAKSNASIKTNKFDNNDSFTKSLTIRFDGLKTCKN